tara:strand:+ start:349 stop:891 length:543 start_codon:yes stop_codon:yes gene_type:complete
MNILKKFALIFSVSILLNSCGGGFKLPKPGDARNIPSDGRERARKNLEEGRGVKAGDLFSGNRKTNYEFSTSNPLWRAAFDVIDFMPLVTVDYSGGMIITDWYTDSNTTNDSLKFTIRFLSNDIRADSLKIIIHKKTCKLDSNCIVTKITSNKLEDTIRSDIIKKAAILDAESKRKKKKS